MLPDAQRHTNKGAAGIGAKKALQDQTGLQRVHFHHVLYSPLQTDTELFTLIKDKYIGTFSSRKTAYGYTFHAEVSVLVFQGS